MSKVKKDFIKKNKNNCKFSGIAYFIYWKCLSASYKAVIIYHKCLNNEAHIYCKK